MARTPKGSIVRSIPDFYPERMYTSGSTIDGVAVDTFANISLYNDAQDGSLLVVWDLDVAAQGVSGAAQPVVIRSQLVYGITGTHFNVPHPLISGGNILAGQIYISNPYTPPSGEDASWALVNGAYFWPHDYPFAFVRPGWSLRIDTDHNAVNVFIANFVWEVVRHI